MNTPSPSHARPRWWPALLFLALAAAAIGWIRFGWDVHQQDKNVWTYLICGVCFLCLLLWLMVLSRLPWRTRWIALGVIALVHGVVLGLFRIVGVDGDLVPIVEWRWKPSRTGRPAPGESSGLASSPVTITGSTRDWPQFLGPHRNGHVEGVRLEADWEHHPLQERWRIPVGPGWSGFAVVDGVAVTQEQRGPEEAIVAMSAGTGRRIWDHTYEAYYATTIAGEGPRATPAIADGRVYAVGATGWLTCLLLENGDVLWATNVFDEFGGAVPEWGYSVSPLVVDDRVVLSAGGADNCSLIAFDAQTGAVRWTGGDDRVSYSSPILFPPEDPRQVVVFNRGSVAGHDLMTGQPLWTQPYPASHVHVAAPLALPNGRILFSSGYGHGSELYSVEQNGDGQWVATREWRSRRLKAKFTNPVVHNGFIYGLDDGILACISTETGERRWKEGRYGHGQVILAGNQLLISTETGEVVLLDANPDGLRELSKFKVFSGKTWNPPALAGNRLYLRTDEWAVCLVLPMADSARAAE